MNKLSWLKLLRTGSIKAMLPATLRRALVAILVVVCTFAGYWYLSKPSWPQFVDDHSSSPQVVVQMDRDYAYHVGDLIPVDVFVWQKPATKVVPSTLALDGDFELATAPQISEKKLEDGSVYYRIHMELQSFQVKPAVVLNATMGWSGGDTRGQLAVPATSFHTSNTYDGRPNLMEGADPRVSIYWYGGRHMAALVGSSVLFFALCLLAVLNYVRSRPAPFVDRSRQRVLELLTILQSGNCSRDEYLELDGLMRERFELGPYRRSSSRHCRWIQG